jgi:hypothetical protein
MGTSCPFLTMLRKSILFHSFLLHSHTGPLFSIAASWAQPNLCLGKGRKRAFLHVQALEDRRQLKPRQSLACQTRGEGRPPRRAQQSPLLSLAVAPAGSSLSPTEGTHGEKQDVSSCVCLCVWQGSSVSDP